MPDIGSTLRETRMRERIDIQEVETATKIRAKYLRALENEEWDLLPGPTFVKTFLRTYGEYLGLDAKMLVEEYRQRYERPSPHDLLPFGPGLGGRRERRRAPAVPPFALVAVCVVALLGVLYFLGRDNDEEPSAPNTVPSAVEEPRDEDEPRRDRRRRPAPSRVRLQIVPSGTVNVCLVAAGGRTLIRSQDLQAGDATRTFRSRRFRVTFGNGQARMRVDGRTIDVPDRSEPVGYEVTPRRHRELAAEQRPTCAA